jgi:hypothetical protein
VKVALRVARGTSVPGTELVGLAPVLGVQPPRDDDDVNDVRRRQRLGSFVDGGLARPRFAPITV